MLLALTLLSALHAAPADSIHGSWQIKGDVVGNPINEICALSQTGMTIGGNCKGLDTATYVVTGEVKDGKVIFKHGGKYEGTDFIMTFTGTLASPTELKGTIDVQPFNAAGDFTAAPVSPAP
jgi:hypothetical protein